MSHRGPEIKSSFCQGSHFTSCAHLLAQGRVIFKTEMDSEEFDDSFLKARGSLLPACSLESVMVS